MLGSSRGPGRHTFYVEIMGSNPIPSTNYINYKIMRTLETYILFVILFLLTSCNCGLNNISTTIDKGILLNKTEYVGRFDVKSYTFYVLYKGNTYSQDVDENIYNQYNVKDSVEFAIRTFGNDLSTIVVFLPKN